MFETLRARGGRLTELAEHVARLRRSAAGLDIELPDDLEAGSRRGIADAPRGRGPRRPRRRRLDPDHRHARRVGVARAAPAARRAAHGDHRDPGLARRPGAGRPPRGRPSLVVSAVRRDPANPIVTLKTTSRADYVFARLEARRAGAEDAVFLTVSGHISESTTANVFLVRPGADGMPELATPSLDCAILPGTTRSWLLALGEPGGPAPRRGLADARRSWRRRDEAFVCSSVAGVLPVTRFNGTAIGDGRPGPWTRRRGRTARGSSSGADAAAEPRLRTPAHPVHMPRPGSRRASRAVSGRFALMTQWVTSRRYPGGWRSQNARAPSAPSQGGVRLVVERAAAARTSRPPSAPARRRPNAASPRGPHPALGPQRLDPPDVPRAPVRALAAGRDPDRRAAFDRLADAVDPADAQHLVDELRPGDRRQPGRLGPHPHPPLVGGVVVRLEPRRGAPRARSGTGCRAEPGWPSASAYRQPGVALDWPRDPRRAHPPHPPAHRRGRAAGRRPVLTALHDVAPAVR